MFARELDALLNDILTDYTNQFNGSVDISQGSLVFIKSACLASALWGIYQHQQWISKQIFPDTADTEQLEHHAWVRGISRRTGETDDELLARLLADIRQPPAGGNRYDYVAWALTIDDVQSAYCYPLEDGVGTVMVVIVADTDTGSETPSVELLADVAAYIDEMRPVTATVSVVAPVFLATDVTMAITGSGVDPAAVAADIEAYLGTFTPGQILYPSQLSAIAIDNGAVDAQVTAPAAAVVPDNAEIIRPGVISVT